MTQEERIQDGATSSSWFETTPQMTQRVSWMEYAAWHNVRLYTSVSKGYMHA